MFVAIKKAKMNLEKLIVNKIDLVTRMKTLKAKLTWKHSKLETSL